MKEREKETDRTAGGKIGHDKAQKPRFKQNFGLSQKHLDLKRGKEKERERERETDRERERERQREKARSG